MEQTKLFRRDFTLVVLGQIISLFGNAILRFALPLYLLRETGSAALFGLVSATSFLPMILLSFLGGVLADRVNKRNIMVILDFITAGIIFLLFLALGKVPIVPLFIVVLMLLYGISGTYQPTVQASIPSLVSQDKILSAGAVVNQVSQLANLLGPIIGGMLFGAFGIVPILLISIACFTASAIMEIFIHIPFEKRKDSMKMIAILKKDFHESVNYIQKENKKLAKIIGLITVFNLVLSAMMIVGTPILIIGTLQMSDEMLGFAQGALAFGGLCGGLFTAIFSKKLALSNSHVLLFLSSFSLGAMAIPLLVNMNSMFCYVVITVASFLIMAFATMFSIQMLAAVQVETPPELIGKVIALLMSLSMCAQPLGQAIYGVIFDQFPQFTGIIVLVVAMISIVISLSSKRTFQHSKG